MIKIFLLFSFVLFSDIRDELSNVIFQDYIDKISQTKEGKNLVKMIKNEDIKIYFEYSDDDWLAWYEPYGKIFFNLKYLMIFFGIEDYKKDKIEKVLRFSKEVRKEFVNYTDFLFVHEVIHHLQHKRYKNLTKYRKEFIELEYEAFIISDIYFFEKIKKNKKFFLDIISNKYYDLYSNYAIGGFISSLNEYNNYLDEIRNRYLQESKGYVILKEVEKKKKIKLEEKKILSYASGNKKSYQLSREEYENIRKTMDSYFLELRTSLKKKWDDYIVDALEFVNKSSFEVKNYELFWRSCYFLKNFYKKKCYMDNVIFNSFSNHISKPDISTNYLIKYVDEIYWFKKVFPQEKSLENAIEGIIKNAILYCDELKDFECLKKIDQIVTTDLIK